MKALMFEIKDKVDETRKTSDKLESDIISDFEDRYDEITKIGLKENPPPLIPQDQPKKRGKKNVRMMKVQQKISGTFRSAQSASVLSVFYFMIFSYQGRRR